MSAGGSGAGPDSWAVLALLFVAAAVGGALNAVAGGGSFVAFPALIFAGVPPVIANATNAVALWPAGLASAFAYRKDLPGQRPLMMVLAGASFVGGATGALLLLKTGDTTFVHILPWLLLVATLLFTAGGKVAARLRGHATSRGALPVVAVAQTIIALYGGYFGGGMGILMLAALSLAGMTNIHAMNALKTILGAVINGVAILLFIAAGAVAWKPGSVMIAGGIVGGYFGASVARKIAPQHVRAIVMTVAWSMTAWFFYAAYVR